MKAALWATVGFGAALIVAVIAGRLTETQGILIGFLGGMAAVIMSFYELHREWARRTTDRMTEIEERLERLERS